MSDADIAWAAGFFDGEGCVSIHYNQHMGGRNVGGWSCMVVAEQNIREALVRFDERTGGHGSVKPPRSGQRTWRWEANGRDNKLAVLEAMLPFLIVKRRQAELAIDFLHTMEGRGQRLSEDTVRRRETIAEEMRSLNLRVPRQKADKSHGSLHGHGYSQHRTEQDPHGYQG